MALELERINVTVSAAAKRVLREYKKRHGYPNQDSALDAFLLDNAGHFGFLEQQSTSEGKND